jgi:phosphate transport system substrate-binding protein
MKAGRANSVTWPTGLAGKGSEGVSGTIQQTANSIGYVELTYAIQNKMTYGKVKNAAGEFTQASLASVTAAAAGMKDMPEDFRVSITNAPGKGVYPISSFTWLLIPSKIADPAKKKAIQDFLAWMLADGQKMTAALDYAPLPKAVITKELKAIDKIQ